MATLSADVITQSLYSAYDLAAINTPLIGGVAELAEDYLKANKYNKEKSIDSLIRWQCSKAGMSGLILGIPGGFLAAGTIPMDIFNTFVIQMRLASSIAYINEYDLHSDQVKIMCIATACGAKTADVLKGVGVKVGEAYAKKMISSISRETIKQINKAVGTRLLTKFGEKGVINLGKLLPIVGGVIGGSVDTIATYATGKAAKGLFKSE